MNVQDKVAVVTGAGTGVGRATARQLAALGCRIVVNYCRSEQSAHEVVAAIQRDGGHAIACQGDVAKLEDMHAVVAATADTYGRLDILVNNAGTTEFVAFEDLAGATDQVWHRLLAVNLLGPFHAATAAVDLMRDTSGADGGEIVNVSSVAGLISAGSSIPYCASKAALNSVTVALARTLAPCIRVNAIAPGFIAGRWLQEGLGEWYESVKSTFEKAMPLQKVCEPEDVAAAIVSVITGSDLITGQILTCDAGMTILNPVSV